MAKNGYRLTGGALGLLTVFLSLPVTAQQLAPVPQRAPHVPVNQQAMPDHRAALMQTRDVEGQAQIVDGDRLRIGDADLRLFGVVPPQLSASFGPQARALLDNLVAGQTTSCHVRDRDRDGRLLASCRVGSTDLGLELLRHGLAVTARGSLTNTDIADAYLAAEQAAEIQHAGLWSVALTPPAAQLVGDAAKTEATAPTKAEAAKAEPVVPKAEIPIKEPAVIKETHENESRQIPVHVGSPGLLYTTDLANSRDDDAGFFQHYQVLIAGGLMFITTFGTVLTLVLQRRYEKREEMKAIAAALRGELMAARAVCMTRLKTIHTDDDDRAATWPRLRSTLYQAYVGKLGWLGAQLSRQIASIYGQASDYAAYYNSIEDATQAPKRRALQTLSGYIDEVLPRLEWVEVTGRRPAPGPASLSHHVEPVAHETILPESVTVEHAPALALPQPAWASVANLPSGLWQAVRQFVHQHLPTQQAANAGSEGQDYDMMLEHSLQPVTFHESAEPEVVEPATSTTPSAPAPVTTPEKPANDTAAAAESVTAAVVKTHTA